MNLFKIKYHKCLADYFFSKPLYLDAPIQSVPDTRKLIEQPWQEIRTAIKETSLDMWNKVIETLCDLYFIEAKCCAGMTFGLIEDYYYLWNYIPDNLANIDEENKKKAKIDQWVKDIIKYSENWSEFFYAEKQQLKSGDIEPQLPESPSACRLWTQDEINQECTKITDDTARLSKILVFKEFVASQSYPLIKYNGIPGFIFQHAYNYQSSSLIRHEAEKILKDSNAIYFSREWPEEPSVYQMPALLRTLESPGLRLVNLMPDGRYVVFIAGDSYYNKNLSIQIWDLENLQCLRTILIDFRTIRCMNVTPDRKYAVLAGELKPAGSESRNGLSIFNLISGQCLKTIEVNTFNFINLFLTPDGRFAISVESLERKVFGKLMNGIREVEIKKGLRLYDIKKGECLKTIDIPNWENTLISVTPNGKHVLLTGSSGTARSINYSNDKNIYLWDIINGKCLKIIDSELGSNISINGIRISPDGSYAMTSEFRKLRFWDLNNGLCQRIITTNNAFNRIDGVTPDWQRGVSISGKSLVIWDIVNGQQIGKIECEVDSMQEVYINADGRYAVSWSSSNGTLNRWNLEYGQSTLTLNKHPNIITLLGVSSDGQSAVTSGVYDNKLIVWSLDNAQYKFPLKIDNCSFKTFSILPTSNQVIAGGGYFGGYKSSLPDPIHVFNMESGQCIYSFGGSTKNVTNLKATPDGKKLVSAHDDNKIRVWDIETGQCLWTLEGHKNAIACLSVSNDSRLAFSGGGGMTYGIQKMDQDCTVRVWDIEKGQCMNILEGHTNFISCIMGIPDTKKIISGGLDHKIRIWDLDSGTCLHVMEIPSNSTIKSSVRCMSLTPDGSYAVSGGTMYGKLILWDIEKGEFKRSFIGHMGDISCVAITANGQFLISACSDRSIRIWDIETGKCIVLYSTSVPVSSMTISPVSSTIICGMTTGDIIVLKVNGIDFHCCKPVTS